MAQKAGEAFAATDQAVEIYYRLGAANPAAHDPDLACSLSNNRPPSTRSLRLAWLTERIRAMHVASRGTYGPSQVVRS